jgi:hypothetical protein
MYQNSFNFLVHLGNVVQKGLKIRGLSPRANCTDRATAAYRRS